MSTKRHSTVVVTPIYEDAEAAGYLFRDLAEVYGESIYVVAVDDGSVRQPVDSESLLRAGLDGAIVKLRRNVGHQLAIAIGLSFVAESVVDEQRVVVMDSDGEDIPRSAKELIDGIADPAVDVVVAKRRNRVETLRFKLFYVVYKWLFRVLTGREISFGNFMALKPTAVRRLISMQELWTHVAASVLASKLRVNFCVLDRGSRYTGQSKMKYVDLALHGFKAMMVFAENVVVRVGIACAIIAGLSVVGVVAALGLKLTGFATPGWFSVALGILVLVFLQTGALTLMILMLSGVVRSGGARRPVDYKDFVESIQYAGRR